MTTTSYRLQHQLAGAPADVAPSAAIPADADKELDAKLRQDKPAPPAPSKLWRNIPPPGRRQHDREDGKWSSCTAEHLPVARRNAMELGPRARKVEAEK